MGNKLDNLLNTHMNSMATSNNSRKMNNKAHNKSPYGEDEPSTRTKYN